MTRVVAAVLAFAVTSALAQQQPYAGLQEREIKALSPDEVKQYLAGAGMGYAKSAELNRYPGPMHVLELADQLDLTPEQTARMRELMETHRRMRALLSEDQVAHYVRLRGYEGGGEHQRRH